MSEVYTIKSVSGPKEWTGSHGPMLSYKLDLDNNGVLERQVELNRKPESRAPEIGELLALDLQETNYGTKAKLDFERTKELTQPQGSPRAPSEAQTGYRDKGAPDIQAQIIRQHSQGCAIAYATLMQSQGKLPAEFGPTNLKTLVDWFDLDVREAGVAVR